MSSNLLNAASGQADVLVSTALTHAKALPLAGWFDFSWSGDMSAIDLNEWVSGVISQQPVVGFFQWFFIIYFLVLCTIYLLLEMVAISYIKNYMDNRSLNVLPRAYKKYFRPISVLVPAFNEMGSIVQTVQSLLRLNYPEFEIIVINDGSTDDTLGQLRMAFDLQPFAEAYRDRLKTMPVRQVYNSRRYANLRVIDKENGGKSDSLNAGINLARYPLYCCMDADSILLPESLLLLAKPFLEDTNTVAAGGTVRILNDCKLFGGFFVKARLPKSMLAQIQVVEYLRAFLFGRLGWAPLNALLIISGAFGLFHKETVIEVGGYRNDTIGEDMEIVVRMHRYLRNRDRDFRIAFVPDPVCWTLAPENLNALKNQRMRWQRGLAESLWRNLGLLFNPKSGFAGWLAMPYMIIFELFSPVIELAGFVFMILGFVFDFISIKALIAFLVVSIGLGMLISLLALLLEIISYRLYKRPLEVATLLFAVVFDNIGYRQLVLFFRFLGLLNWIFVPKRRWGQVRHQHNMANT
ncbi:MAG: glycosyltransferase [Vampirovibrionales bacterium]